MSTYMRGAWSRSALLFAVVWLACAACGSDGRPAEPDLSAVHSRIIGSNCAGVAPVMTADDGAPRAAQSVLAHYYQVLELYRVLAGDRDSFQTDVPPSLRSDVAYRKWQAKTIEILADVGEVGFANRWYEGTFGMLGVGSAGESCELVGPSSYQRTGLLAHTGLLQAAQCGENSDGDPRFWEVRPIALLWIGAVYDVEEMLALGLAEPAPEDHGPCLVWQNGGSMDGGSPACDTSYPTDAITEGVVLDLASSEVVAGVPVVRRAFTARGTEPLGGLESARQVLRSDQFAAAEAIGQPDFSPAGSFVDENGQLHRLVRLVGHRAGPLETPNSLLRDEERAQVDGMVGTWTATCCDCEPEPRDAGPVVDAGPVLDAGQALTGADCACAEEPPCQSGYLSDGLVVVLTRDTIAECGGDCPHPAVDPPAEEPLCAE
ncbi:MAG TPA: hypothetical protein VNO33_07820 [Kofleriaceae bacterium]|nr:hypothetical protein [Kofleriaceae bacterium]